MKLTNAQARRFLVRLHFGPERRTLRDHMDGLGSIQFDPLNVVGRNPDLVLQSRIRNYRPDMLHAALYGKNRWLMDGFDKCMCVFPMEDFPRFARIRAGGYGNLYDMPQVRAAFGEVVEQIRLRGALCSSDLNMPDKVDWPWAPTNLGRAALEAMWFEGRLILSHKKGVRRYYDLIENHLPAHILGADDPFPGGDDAYDEWMILRRVGSVGMLWNRNSDAYLMTRVDSERRGRAFQRLLDRGELIRLDVEGIDEPLCSLRRDEPILRSIVDGEDRPDKTMRLLAPLDNLIWDRRLIEALFGFYYRWEVYVPKDKRQFGYYVLPALWNDRLVGRFEPDHYRGGTLNIKRWWWEPGVKPTKPLLAAREKALERFCAYLGADGWQIETDG